MSLTAWAVIIIAALMAVLGFVVSGWQEARGKISSERYNQTCVCMGLCCRVLVRSVLGLV